MKSLTQKTIGLLVSLFTIGITVHAQQIGEIYQGGYIFHISEDGTQGLVAATEDLGQFAWGCNETSISGADGQGIGTGYQNTLDIVAGCSQTPIAASEALAYESEGYSDWYLPSKDELKEMYNTIGNGSPEGDIGGFGSNWYWSSSENVSTSAWYVYFDDGYTSTSGRKSPEFRVRVIRSVTFGQEMVLTECGPDEYESMAPTSSTDRECSALSICSADEYELVPATATSDRICETIVEGCMDATAYNYNANANTDDGSCISWEELANNLQSELDNVVIEDGIGQSDLDAAVEQAYAEGAASVTPEDGIGQADVDAAYAAGAASVTPEDGVSQADVDAAFTNGVASVEVPECEEVSTQNIPIDLPQGWSMFGYTCLDSVDAATGFSEIADQIEIVKDEWGLSYLPSWDFNALGGLHYSEGYQIKMKEAITNFQFCEAIVPEDGITQADVDAAHAMYEGWCASDIDNDGICDVDEVSGCMDETACNYNSEAEFDDGSCYNNDLGCGCDQPEAQEGYDCEGNEIISYQVGDLAHGGIVFYVDETGVHGLVAALEDLTEGATDPNGLGFNGYEWWGCYEKSVNGADGTSIGTGYQNTLDIVNQGCTTENGGVTAAQAALDAEINGYSDWYIPSKDGLLEMYSTIGNGGSEGNIGGFETSGWPYYWSSSETNRDFAWLADFGNGGTGYNNKSNTYRVRVIRAF